MRPVLLLMMLVLLLGLATGCGDLKLWGDPEARAKEVDSEASIPPFRIGPATDWEEEKLYLDYADSHKVALVSRHDMLVALLLINPDTGNTVRYDPTSGLFRDPQDGSMFTSNGLVWGSSNSKNSLRRCRIRHMGSLDDPEVVLMVDPAKLFSYERGEWSKAASNHLYWYE